MTKPFTLVLLLTIASFIQSTNIKQLSKMATNALSIEPNCSKGYHFLKPKNPLDDPCVKNDIDNCVQYDVRNNKCLVCKKHYILTTNMEQVTCIHAYITKYQFIIFASTLFILLLCLYCKYCCKEYHEQGQYVNVGNTIDHGSYGNKSIIDEHLKGRRISMSKSNTENLVREIREKVNSEYDEHHFMNFQMN